MFCEGWISPQACYRFNYVSMSNNKGLVRLILESKIARLPFSCTIRNVIKNLMQ